MEPQQQRRGQRMYHSMSGPLAPFCGQVRMQPPDPRRGVVRVCDQMKDFEIHGQKWAKGWGRVGSRYVACAW